MSKPEQRQERRQVNAAVGKDRRGEDERRRCPDCGGALALKLKRVAGGTVRSLSCAKCDWSQSTRSTDADVLLLKLSWALDLKNSNGQLSAQVPGELSDALKLKAGDQLVVSPLTSPVGSLPMKWALSVSRKKR
jgi:hypothetical protein